MGRRKVTGKAAVVFVIDNKLAVITRVRWERYIDDVDTNVID